MRRPALAALSAAAALFLSTVAMAASASAAPSQQELAHRNDHVCTTATPGNAAGLAIRHDTVDAAGNALTVDATRPRHATPAGYGPSAIQSAYKLAGATSGGRTVAIVDAYNDP